MTSPSKKRHAYLTDANMHSLCKVLDGKYSNIKAGNKSLISEDLRDLMKLLFYGAQTENLHGGFAISTVEFLKHVLSFSDVRSVQNGVNFKNKLLILLSLKLIYAKQQGSVILSNDFKGKYYFQFLFHTLQRIVNHDFGLLKNIVLQGITSYDINSGIPKTAILFLPSTLLPNNESWDSEHAGEISKKICQWILLHCNQVTSPPGKKTLFAAKSHSMVRTITEIDGSACRGIFTILNISQTYRNEALLNIYCFSVLKYWIIYLQYEENIVECLTNQLSKLATSRENQSHSNSPVSIGGSKFYDDLSSGSDSVDSISFSSSMSSMHSFMYVDDLTNDHLEVRRSPRATPSFDSRPQTPFRKQSQALDTISITSDIFSNATNLKSIVIRYCLCVISQSERVPRRDSDHKVVTASVVESIQILDILCSEDSGSAQKVYVEIRRLYQRIEKNPFSARRVFVSLLQFFIHHYEDMLLQVDDYLEIYFQGVSNFHQNQTAVYEMLDLCLKNCVFFQDKTTLLFKYFPNVLKSIAWWPHSFLEEACGLIVMFVNEFNASEVLHAILDLPCLSVLLLLKQQNILEDSVKLEQTLGVPIKAYFTAMFSFILRETSGGADTIDKLSELHVALTSMESNPRVKYTSDIVSSLLLSYFTAVDDLNEIEVLKNIFPIILERAYQLFPSTDNYVSAIHEIFSNQIQIITRLVPDIVSVYCEEFVAFISQAAGYDSFDISLLTSVIWCVGESGAKDYCTSTQISVLYKNMETFMYEVSQKIGKCDDFMTSPEIVCSMMSTLAKLASFSQEWIPRAIVCLSKIIYSQQTSGVQADFLSVTTYARELIHILQKPKVAPSILCDEKKMKPWHEDADSSLLLKVHLLSRYATD